MTEPRLETSRKVYTNHWSLQLSRFMKGSCCWRKSVFSMINSILWRKETHKQHLYLKNDLKMIVIFHNYHKMIWIFNAFPIFILRNKCDLFKRNLILRNQHDLSHIISSFVDLFSIRILVENININKLGRESVRKLDISSVLHQNSFSGYSFHRGQTLPQEGQLNVLKYNFFMAH